MEVKEAVLAFSQSEKVKTGLIWASQALDMTGALAEPEKRGAVKTIETLLGMLMHEIRLARNVSGGTHWEAVATHLDQALIMIKSGVAQESVSQLTRALSLVTTIGQRSMTVLKTHDLV